MHLELKKLSRLVNLLTFENSGLKTVFFYVWISDFYDQNGEMLAPYKMVLSFSKSGHRGGNGAQNDQEWQSHSLVQFSA